MYKRYINKLIHLSIYLSIYCPPSFSTHSKPFSVFSVTSVLFCPSLQPHLMNSSSPATLTFISQFLSLVSSFNLRQHVHFPTHDKNHILDLIITSFRYLIPPAVSFTHWSPSDHFPVFTRLSLNQAPLLPLTLHSFWRLHSA